LPTGSHAIAQRWGAALVLEEFARHCISLARQRCEAEGRADFVDRLDRIGQRMDSGDFHG
jgi:hypothetical protein